MTHKSIKICLAASAGGHLTQLLMIKGACQEYDVFYVTSVDAVRDKLQRFGRTYIVGECNREYILRTIIVLFRTLKIIIKERPDVVISTGAAPGLLCCLWGKLLGAKVVWLDSIANTEKLSMSGQMIRPFANLILTQWQGVADKYTNVEYAGSVV